MERNQEGFWFGDVNAGMQCLFRAENYRRPLNTNFYKMQPLNMPPSWFNDGKGGISYKEKGNQVDIKTYSGSRTPPKGRRAELRLLGTGNSLQAHRHDEAMDRPLLPRIPACRETERGDAHAYQAVDVVGETGANVINPASRQCGESAYQLSFLPPCLHEAVRRRIACQKDIK